MALTRASQTVFLSDRGDERLHGGDAARPAPLARRSASAQRRIEPQFDIFNLANASTVADSINVGVGSTYWLPATIVAPRIMHVGFSLNF